MATALVVLLVAAAIRTVVVVAARPVQPQTAATQAKLPPVWAPATVGRRAPDRAAQARRTLGFVFQNPDDQLFSPTVFEDVAFGPLYQGLPEDEVRRRGAWALAQVGMTGYESRLSHHLSLGEKKRVAIATVLSMEPELLVLDEPTAGLDPRGRRQLIALLRALPLTMLISTHDMALVAELFPRMVIMDEGLIVADGATGDLLAQRDLLEAHGLESPPGSLR